MTSATDRLTDIFLQLVKIDSPTGKENEISEFLANFLAENKLVDEVKKDDLGNVYGYKKGSGNPIFLTAHMDTVEPGCSVNPKIEEGFIVSDRSTILGVDDKAGITAILETLFRIKEENLKSRDIEIIFTVSEEIGNMGAIGFDKSWLKATSGFCFDYSGDIGIIVKSSPFYERFDIEIEGKSTHSSRPEEGINTLSALAKFLTSLPYGQVEEGVLLNIGVINGGFVRNSVPGKVNLEGEIRALNKNILEKYKKLVEFELKKTEVDGIITNVTFTFENGGYVHDEKSELFTQAINSMNSLDINPQIENTWGVSDANIFNESGLLCLNLGDGGEGAHTKEERIKIDSLKSLSELILKITSYNN